MPGVGPGRHSPSLGQSIGIVHVATHRSPTHTRPLGHMRPTPLSQPRSVSTVHTFPVGLGRQLAPLGQSRFSTHDARQRPKVHESGEAHSEERAHEAPGVGAL
jgi:hypothetical protein